MFESALKITAGIVLLFIVGNHTGWVMEQLTAFLQICSQIADQITANFHLHQVTNQHPSILGTTKAHHTAKTR